MTESYNIIEEKLTQFTRKFYLNKIIKGSILSLTVILVFGLLLLILEYFFYFKTYQRVSIVIIFSTSILGTVLFLIIIPLLKYSGFLKRINKNVINDIVVSHFPEIKDKLYNIIELNEKGYKDIYSEELVVASINQKIDEIKKFRFSEAIDIKKNIKLFYYLFFSVIVILLISFISPQVIVKPSERYIHFNKEYEKPSPYTITIINDTLKLGKGDDFTINVKIESKKDFENLFICINDNKFLMKNDSLNIYSYKLSNVNNDIKFNFLVENYYTKEYFLDVLEKPGISEFKIKLLKPDYTLMKDEEFQNLTEVIIPAGTEIIFEFNTYETDSLFVHGIDNFNKKVERYKKNTFTFKNSFTKDSKFYLSLKNSGFLLEEFLYFNIKVINDDYPLISVSSIIDSIDFTKVYFKGNVSDDYGFSRLNFVTKISDKIDTIQELNISKNQNEQSFYFGYDFNRYKSIDKKIEYYFEIFDNDIITGPKSAISEIFYFSFPEFEDVLDYQDKQLNEIENILTQSMNLNDALKKDIFYLKEKMINSELSAWERKEIFRDILNKKELLEKNLDNIKEKNAELNNYLESFTDQNEDILEKQKLLQEMLEQVFSDDLKKMLEEFNKMMNEFNNDKLNEMNDKLDISLEDLSKQLDRNIELLKKMHIEQKLDLLSENLKKQIKENELISDKLDNGIKPQELKEKEESIKNEIEKIEKEYNDIKNLNEELENKINLFEFSKEFNDIKDELQNSILNMEKNNKKKSSEASKKATEKMKNLSFMMQQMMDEAFKEANMENISDLMQILDNLVTFSFNQESIIVKDFNQEFSPLLYGKQKKVAGDFEIIKDSLYALAMREPSINSIVNKEIVTIKQNFKDLDNNFSQNSFSQIPVNQQNVLTSSNNLALFMSEVIKNLQKQMADSKPGNQNCQKPGNNPNPNSSNSSMKNMQKSLQQQLEKIMQMMKEGNQGKSMNNELGKALSQQEKLHQMMQQMMNQGQVGSDAYETLKKADQLLNQVRDDILRKNISSSTIERQKQIMTRLLEAEKAENERDIDEKRKSNTAKDQFISESAKLFENLSPNNNFEEKLIRNKLVLSNFYQRKYQKFIYQLDSINGAIYKDRIKAE
ncbi:MAG: hypothetical protein KA807_04510 [Prolixibacteraceae bacterium]|nr:hypothetical protein [Prolixibacteraceae bacterium]